MALNRIIDSCRRAHEYPSNLIDSGAAYPSILREYRQRLTRRAEQLFCAEGRAATEFFRFEELQNQFRSDVSTSLQNLRQHLPCSRGHVQKDKLCSFFFIGAQSSRDVLQISHEMMLWLLSVFQIL